MSSRINFAAYTTVGVALYNYYDYTLDGTEEREGGGREWGVATPERLCSHNCVHGSKFPPALFSGLNIDHTDFQPLTFDGSTILIIN